MEEDKTQKQTVSNEDLAKAKNEIEEVLKKYKVILIPIVVHQGDKTFSRIDISPVGDV